MAAEAEHYEKVGHLEAKVEALTKTVEKLFTKFDDYVERSAPRQMGFPAIMAIVAAGLSSLAVIFGCVLYIVNSATAPLIANLSQQAVTIQAVQELTMQTSNAFQLAKQEVSVVRNQAQGTDDTLRWMLFDENLPKQIEAIKGRIAILENQINGDPKQ